MATTTHRPAPLPRTTAAGTGASKGGGPLPDGAARMSKMWLDERDRPGSSPTPVPVDADDRRTPHVRMACPHMRTVNGGGKEPCGHGLWLLPDQKRFCPDHGDQLVAPKEGNPLVELVADARRMYGRHAAAWGLPAAAVLADGGLTLAGVGLEAAIAAPALAAGTWAAAQSILTRQAVAAKRIEKGQRKGRRVQRIRDRARHAGLVAGETTMWAAALAAVDFTSTMGAVVAAAGAIRWAVGVKPWWDAAEKRRLRDLDGTVEVTLPEIPVVQAPDPVELRAVTTWETLIGCAGGPLAGTKLVEFRRLPACEVGAASRTRLPNWSAKVIPLVAGSINMREHRPALPGRIAAAYGCTYADVSFAADESDLGVGWLRVQPDNVLAEVRLWPGPGVANDWKRGRSVIGRYDDGLPIEYVWWTNIGAAHDLISGCSGSGKSELVAQLILASLHSGGLVIDWLGDPQGGQSYGALKDQVDWFARDTSEIRFMLLAALKEMLRRNDELSRRNIKTWKPSKDMPLLVVTLDEVQAYIEDPIILDLVEKLVGQGRKCGIKMRCLTQIPAAYNLGGSTYIKEQLKTGQSIIMRAMTDQAGRDATDGDCPINPTMLPKKWGKHTCAAGQTTAGLLFVQGLTERDVYGRADWTGEDMMRWLVNEDGVSTCTPGVFSAAAQAASGALWGDRHERAKRLIAAGRSDADLLPGGKAVELIEAASVASQDAARREGQRPAPGVQSAPAAGRARDVVLDEARRVADGSGMVTRDAIVKAVAGQMADGTRDKALTDLVADGLLRRVRNGLYEVPGAGSEQLALDAGGAA